MGLTKRAAFQALAQKIRKRYGLSVNESLLLGSKQIAEYAASSELPYRRFAEVYTGKEFAPGGHPDYEYLTEPDNIGKTEKGEITTFFLDLRNFTKYCCFLSKEKVYQAKSAVIAAVIDVGRMYGGHLHEIPGDGVLFFFGRKEEEAVESATNAIEAACDAMGLLEENLIPEYNEEEYPDIYPKMGIDFGSALWGVFGADPYYEVKATSFNVDIASKMMCQCKSKEIAVGDDLKEFVVLNEDKYLKRGWKYERTLTVRGEKKSVAYQTWMLDWRIFRGNEMNQDLDLSKLGLIATGVEVSKSKSKLGDAPLA